MSNVRKPALISQVFESRRPRTEASLAALHAAAVLAGYQWFASEGEVFFIRSDNGGDFESIGRLEDVPGPRVFAAQVPIQKVEVDPTTLLAPTNAPSIFVFDDFYAKPDEVRALALRGSLEEHPERHKGKRSEDFPINAALSDAIASVMFETNINGYSAFQLNVAGDQRVYHSDTQRWAAAVYLTPNPPPDGGTSFYRSRTTRVRQSSDVQKFATLNDAAELEWLTYGDGAILDRTRWTEVDRVGNVYNRLVVWSAGLVHGVTEPFGHDWNTGRLTQLFFFDPA